MSHAPAGDAPLAESLTPSDERSEAGGVTRLVLSLAYDGSAFRGFAEQPQVATVAGGLADALERIFGVRSRVVCAGRTDAGVHALTQVVHVDIPTEALERRYGASLDEAALRPLCRSLTHQLSPFVGVHAASVAPVGFDARRSALWRRYRYDLDCSDRLDPSRSNTSWHVGFPLDIAAMRLAIDPLIGEHDFAAFCRHAPGESGPIPRRVIQTSLEELERGLVRFEITAVAFCHQMVRSIVGALVAVGEGRFRPPDLVTMLRTGSRAGAPSPAPAKGLMLVAVGYPDAFGGERS